MIILSSHKEFLGLLSVLILFFAYVFYCKEVVSKNAKPHAISWFIWAVAGVVGFFGQRSDSAGAGSWMVGFMAAACSLIFILALIFGERTILKVDWLCLLLALFAILLWILLKTPLWSVILISLIDGIGFLPTYRKTWSKPYGEPLFVYSLSAFSGVISILALERFSFITALYPSVVTLMNFLLVAAAAHRRNLLPKNSSSLQL